VVGASQTTQQADSNNVLRLIKHAVFAIIFETNERCVALAAQCDIATPLCQASHSNLWRDAHRVDAEATHGAIASSVATNFDIII
jgi:hypothetical protein